MLSQLLEKGSLLRQPAQQQGKKTAVAPFGATKNTARGLMEQPRATDGGRTNRSRRPQRQDPDLAQQQLPGGWLVAVSGFGRVDLCLAAVVDSRFSYEAVLPVPFSASPPLAPLLPPTPGPLAPDFSPLTVKRRR